MLTLHDPTGASFYVNAYHIVRLHPVHDPESDGTELVLSTGETLMCRETAEEVSDQVDHVTNASRATGVPLAWWCGRQGIDPPSCLTPKEARAHTKRWRELTEPKRPDFG